MEKLSTQYNLHWSLLGWVASFLQGRAQVTRVDASVSAPLYLNGGIPQGTELGPVLFFLFCFVFFFWFLLFVSFFLELHFTSLSKSNYT